MDLLDQLLTPDERRPMTVSELTGKIRRNLEDEFASVWIEGELSNFVRHSSGHWYFTLKDDRAQIRAACFRNANMRIRFRPEDGLKVRVRGRISVYEPRGDFQLIAEAMEPAGIGAAQLAFAQLKAKLDREGLFDAARKRPIPTLPRRVGVVTSPTGAAVRDILRVLERRNNAVHVLIYPSAVEGEGAAKEITAGIRWFAEHADGETSVDVLIVGRGGGSAESLAAFNDEGVARAIFASPIPVISAVGHEIDFTIADFVADLRAPTPSAAAEIVAARRDELTAKAARLTTDLERLIRFRLMALRSRLQDSARHHVFPDTVARLRDAVQQTDELTMRLHQSASAHLETARRRVAQAVGELDALSPLRVLERGYAIARNREGTLVKRAGDVRVGDRLHVRVREGEIRCEVLSTEDV